MAGKGGSNICPGLIYAFIWLLVLLVVWWFSFIISWFYVFFLPFTVCCSPCKGATDALLKLIQLPLTVAENMVNMKPLC